MLSCHVSCGLIVVIMLRTPAAVFPLALEPAVLVRVTISIEALRLHLLDALLEGRSQPRP